MPKNGKAAGIVKKIKLRVKSVITIKNESRLVTSFLIGVSVANVTILIGELTTWDTIFFLIKQNHA